MLLNSYRWIHVNNVSMFFYEFLLLDMADIKPKDINPSFDIFIEHFDTRFFV